jgi:arylsulfatase
MKAKLCKTLRLALILTTLTACAITQPAGVGGADLEKKPNIVFVLADNVGYGDLGAYGGGELRGCPTPRIDQLAREGLRLTQFLVEPACTPSRAALLTGRCSIREGLSLIIIAGTPNTRVA